MKNVMFKNWTVSRAFSLLLLLGIVILNACSQRDKETPAPQTAKVPHFDETNSVTYTWDKLPAELRNASPIVSEKSSANAREAVSNYSYSIGPWGGGGGGYFNILPPSGSRIYAMAIRSGSYVDRLTVWYIRSDGSIYVGGDVGGNGGSYYLQFFSGNEYIYSVAGRSGKHLDRLIIYTNYKSFGYGGNGGSVFNAGVPAGYQFLGFWGRSGSLVDQIGFYVYTR